MPQADGEEAQVLSRLERLKHLVLELDQLAGDSAERQRVRDRMHREIDATKKAVNKLATHDRHHRGR